MAKGLSLGYNIQGMNQAVLQLTFLLGSLEAQIEILHKYKIPPKEAFKIFAHLPTFTFSQLVENHYHNKSASFLTALEQLIKRGYLARFSAPHAASIVRQWFHKLVQEFSLHEDQSYYINQQEMKVFSSLVSYLPLAEVKDLQRLLSAQLALHSKQKEENVGLKRLKLLFDMHDSTQSSGYKCLVTKVKSYHCPIKLVSYLSTHCGVDDQFSNPALIFEPFKRSAQHLSFAETKAVQQILKKKLQQTLKHSPHKKKATLGSIKLMSNKRCAFWYPLFNALWWQKHARS